jgi:hypothetical protein
VLSFETLIRLNILYLNVDLFLQVLNNPFVEKHLINYLKFIFGKPSRKLKEEIYFFHKSV